jgi:ABC-type transport system involved in multi-copper enzyme maturation permease subunit
LRRADVLLGRWLGSALVVVAYAAASGLLAIAVTAFVSGYGPPDPLLAVAFLAAEALVLLTLTLALGSVLPSIAAGAIAVVGFGLGWMAGVLATVATAPGVTALGPVAEASRWLPPRRPVGGVIYGLTATVRSSRPGGAGARECQSVLRDHSAPLAFVVWSIVWMALVLGAATWWFERRDLSDGPQPR